MRDYWITMHWPHPVPDDLPWHVYFKETDWHQGYPLKIDDVVLFREARELILDSRRVTTVRHVANGIARIVDLPIGAGGLVGCAKIIERVAPIPATEPRYYYGDPGKWSHWVKCGPLGRGGPIAYKEMLQILGLPATLPAYTFGLHRIKNKAIGEQLIEMLGQRM
jgi:hypothetical protein